MKILVACEFSAIVRDAFRAKGHDAWSCDILETEGDPRWHIQDDVLNHLNKGWDMLIAHPPCTYLAQSGVQYLHREKPTSGGALVGKARFLALQKGCEFFNKLVNADISKICVENPVPHRYARELVGKYTQIYRPWQFGDNESKTIFFWTKALPPLISAIKIKPEGVLQSQWRMPPSKDRAKERSRFFPGIAAAMAAQWG